MGLRFPIRVAKATGTTIPRFGFKVDQFAIAIPDGGPLSAVGHAIVTEESVEVSNWVLEGFCGIKGLVVFTNTLSEDKPTENSIRVGCDGALEAAFNSQGDMRSGGDGGRVGYGRRWRDGWAQGDGWRERDGWAQGDSWALSDGWRGREVLVSDRFGVEAQEQGHGD